MSVVPSPATFRELRLRNFRNLRELDLALPVAGVAIIGDNGAGKTNLLEALYYLEIFRSFRGAPDEQLVHFGDEAFHLRARTDGAGAVREVAVGFERRGRRKRVRVDNNEPERLGDALGSIGVVIFSPSDLALVAGSPGERRRFLDILLSLNRAGYLAALQRYRQVLRHRNALLRAGSAAAALAPWDEALAEWGGRIVAWRAAWVAEVAPGFARRYGAIAGGPTAKLVYASSLALDDEVPTPAEAAERFLEELRRMAQRERDRGVTLVGPHREDLAVRTERGGMEVELRDFGSGGQQRTAAIALRMVEAETVRETRGREPVVLLDDVFAELDPGRSRRILELLEAEERGQVILTAPKASDLELRHGSLEHWGIANGRVQP